MRNLGEAVDTTGLKMTESVIRKTPHTKNFCQAFSVCYSCGRLYDIQKRHSVTAGTYREWKGTVAKPPGNRSLITSSTKSTTLGMCSSCIVKWRSAPALPTYHVQEYN